MRITNKQTVLIYTLSSFVAGVVFMSLMIFIGIYDVSFDFINIKFNEPFSYLFNVCVLNSFAYVFGVVTFLIFFVVSPRLINLVLIKKSQFCRLLYLIVAGGVLIILLKFTNIFSFRITEKFFSSILATSPIIAIYILIFFILPKEMTGLDQQKRWIDKVVYFILCGMTGSILLGLCASLFYSDQLINLSVAVGANYLSGLFGMILFFIPAMLTGIYKVFINHYHPFKQAMLCSAVGFSLTALEVALVGKLRVFVLISCLGGITALLVTIIVNLLDTSKKQVSVKQA